VNPFKAFKKPAPATTVPVIARSLPEVNSFVFVTIGESEEFLPIESIIASSFAVRCPKNAQVGAKALFAYSQGTAKFQFDAACTQIQDQTATFDKPQDITLVARFSDRRSAFRLKCALPVVFRSAPDGIASGEFVETSVADISIAGASMLLPSEPLPDERVEITFALKGQDEPFTVIATIARAGHEQPSGKFLAGLKFHGLDALEIKAIDSFMILYQQGIRERNLAFHAG
jgi:hypothetical protein